MGVGVGGGGVSAPQRGAGNILLTILNSDHVKGSVPPSNEFP